MKAKKYLSQAGWLDELIDNKIRYQEKLRTIAEKTTVDISIEKVSGGSANSREDIIVKLVDLSHEVNADIDRLVDLQKELRDTIKQVEDGRLRLLLEMRYLNGEGWDDIARVFDCDRSTVFRSHKKALSKVEKLLVKCD